MDWSPQGRALLLCAIPTGDLGSWCWISKPETSLNHCGVLARVSSVSKEPHRTMPVENVHQKPTGAPTTAQKSLSSLYLMNPVVVRLLEYRCEFATV